MPRAALCSGAHRGRWQPTGQWGPRQTQGVVLQGPVPGAVSLRPLSLLCLAWLDEKIVWKGFFWNKSEENPGALWREGYGCEKCPSRQNIRTSLPAGGYACYNDPHCGWSSVPLARLRIGTMDGQSWEGEGREGNTCWRRSRGASIRHCCCVTRTRRRSIASCAISSTGGCGGVMASAQLSPRAASSRGRKPWRPWPTSSPPTQSLPCDAP